MTALPVVSLVIPCRNEEVFISGCIESIISSDYPKDKLDVIIVDGMSDDRTIDKINNTTKFSFIRLFANPKKITSAGMNIGIKNAVGDLIIILSSHSMIDKDFIRKSVDALLTNPVDCVGGIIKTIPYNEKILSTAISIALSNPFGVGNSYFRIGSEKPRFVDTVPFGCYKREVFENIGLFDEDLIRNQDDEFNFRLIKNGGKVLLIPNIISYYYARNSIKNLWRMYYQYGIYKPLVAIKTEKIFTVRQLIPSIFVCCLLFTGIFSFLNDYFYILFIALCLLYLGASFFISFHSSIINKNYKLILLLMICFGVLHFSYGFGYLKGIWDFLIMKKHKKHELSDLTISR